MPIVYLLLFVLVLSASSVSAQEPPQPPAPPIVVAEKPPTISVKIRLEKVEIDADFEVDTPGAVELIDCEFIGNVEIRAPYIYLKDCKIHDDVYLGLKSQDGNYLWLENVDVDGDLVIDMQSKAPATNYLGLKNVMCEDIIDFDIDSWGRAAISKLGATKVYFSQSLPKDLILDCDPNFIPTVIRVRNKADIRRLKVFPKDRGIEVISKHK